MSRRIGVVTLEEFLGAEKFARGCGGNFETFGRIDFVELLEDLVAADVFGMAEDVEAAEPASHGEAHEQQDEDGPEEEVVLLGRNGKGIEVAGVKIAHLPGCAEGSRRGRARIFKEFERGKLNSRVSKIRGRV